MRTTLDIDDDVLAAVEDLARQQGRSAGEVVSLLLRRALTGGAAPPARGRARGPAPVAGFRPFAPRCVPVTNEAVNALRDAEGSEDPNGRAAASGPAPEGVKQVAKPHLPEMRALLDVH